MTQRSQQPWATVLADDLRGLDTARRWGMAVGAAVLLLGVAVAATGWSRAAEAADRPYPYPHLAPAHADAELTASPTQTPDSLASSRPAAPTRP